MRNKKFALCRLISTGANQQQHPWDTTESTVQSLVIERDGKACDRYVWRVYVHLLASTSTAPRLAMSQQRGDKSIKKFNVLLHYNYCPVGSVVSMCEVNEETMGGFDS